MGRTTKSPKKPSTRATKKVEVEVGNGVPDNGVNKTANLGKSSLKEKKSAEKLEKRKQNTEAIELRPANQDVSAEVPKKKRKENKAVATATYEENDEFVTLQVEGIDQDFEDGELRMELQFELMARAVNFNTSATISHPKPARADDSQSQSSEAWQARQTGEASSVKDKRNNSNNEDEELQEVTKKIAGETLALVKDMMEKSGLLHGQRTAE